MGARLLWLTVGVVLAFCQCGYSQQDDLANDMAPVGAGGYPMQNPFNINSNYNEPPYKEPNYNKKRFKRPNYKEPPYNGPNYPDIGPNDKKPRYKGPNYKKPRYKEPRNKKPRYKEPRYKEPNYNVKQRYSRIHDREDYHEYPK